MDNRTAAGLQAAALSADLRILELTAELTPADGTFDLDAASARQQDAELACVQKQGYAAATGLLAEALRECCGPKNLCSPAGDDTDRANCILYDITCITRLHQMD